MLQHQQHVFCSMCAADRTKFDCADTGLMPHHGDNRLFLEHGVCKHASGVCQQLLQRLSHLPPRWPPLGQEVVEAGLQASIHNQGSGTRCNAAEGIGTAMQRSFKMHLWLQTCLVEASQVCKRVARIETACIRQADHVQNIAADGDAGAW